jgi:hypothetical protein
VGIPAKHITTTDADLHIVFTPPQARRFSTVLAVLEESSAVGELLHEVWTLRARSVCRE